jgi:expansin (peptidoglycan-binding protein)
MTKDKPIQDLLSMSEGEIVDLVKNNYNHFLDTVSYCVAGNFKKDGVLNSIIDILDKVLKNNFPNGNKKLEIALLNVKVLEMEIR